MDGVLAEVARTTQSKSDWRTAIRQGEVIVGEVRDSWFKLRFRGLTRNAYRPELSGRVVQREHGSEVIVTVEQPQVWAAKAIRFGMMAILPVVFVAGVIGMITGGHTTEGGSLLPFVTMPVVIGAFAFALDALLVRLGRSQERRLLDLVGQAAR